ncbi:MAG: S1/P1 Nuclease [Alphaproteobacteria bacterium]|nr:S1/P1 Nuclease [Alphaproteobacteria bacterium]MDE2110646.1 S1/P1 Nuclease [Alphaproteobacteria bacterium]MDE2495075.1 S1/P1 Nuclease [Alphaproteobacteria bacterium]
MDIRARLMFSASLAVVLGLTSPGAFAWGPDGHRMIGELAIETLPPDLPAFLRATAAAKEVGYLAPEADRERGAGETFDAEHSPAHFVDVSDDLTILGGPKLDALPATRAEYDTALRAVGSDQYKAGYLPYSIVSGFQLLAKDLAYWRVDVAGEKLAKTKTERVWYAHDRAEREKIVLHDLGIWAHFVGDGSMPMHASVHYNGWGDFPNPEGFTQEHVHVPFENQYVHDNVTEAEVATAMPSAHDCSEAIMACIEAYLAATQAEVVPFYKLQKSGAFAKPTPEGEDFAARRIAAAAAELRDLTVAAWQESDKQSVGYPPAKVSDVEAGKIDPYAELIY